MYCKAIDQSKMDVHEFNTPVGKLCPVYCLIAPTYSQFPYNYHAD